MDHMGTTQGKARDFGQANVPHDPLEHQFAHCADGLLYRCFWIEAMQVIQIDVIRTQAFQARLARGPHVLGPTVDALLAGHARALQTKFRGEHDLLAPANQELADQFLVGVRPIRISRVQEIPTQFQVRLKHPQAFGFICRTVALTHAHAPQTKARDFKCSKFSHYKTSSSGKA